MLAEHFDSEFGGIWSHFRVTFDALMLNWVHPNDLFTLVKANDVLLAFRLENLVKWAGLFKQWLSVIGKVRQTVSSSNDSLVTNHTAALSTRLSQQWPTFGQWSQVTVFAKQPYWDQTSSPNLLNCSWRVVGQAIRIGFDESDSMNSNPIGFRTLKEDKIVVHRLHEQNKII